jgi:hypothetical protein
MDLQAEKVLGLNKQKPGQKELSPEKNAKSVADLPSA